MTLTQEDIRLIKASFHEIQAREGYLAEAFYRALFRNTPEARAMFPEDLSGQMEKFINMIDFLVNNLSTPWIFTGKVRRLARRHLKYGAQPEHYALVGEALLNALQELTPLGLTEAERLAWSKAYRGISMMMIEAAYPDAA